MGARAQQMTAHGCSSPTARCRLAQSDFYVCPKDNRNRETGYRCGGYQVYFCYEWGCETTGAAYWRPTSSWDSITVSRNYTKAHPDGRTCYHPRGGDGSGNSRWKPALSLPLKISFTDKGKNRPLTEWQQGYTWGLRWYLPGEDKGVIFKIHLKIENPQTYPVGPNFVLPDQKPSKTPALSSSARSRPPTSHTSPSNSRLEA